MNRTQQSRAKPIPHENNEQEALFRGNREGKRG